MFTRAMIGLTLLFWALPVAAERISLAAAMDRARSSAREVAAAWARADASARRLEQAKSYRLPRLRLEESWMRTDSPADVFGLQLQQERFSFAEFVAGDPNQPDSLENALTRLELTLPVYTGGELSGRMAQARLAAEAASETARRVEESAALAAAEAYVRLAQARERVALLERSLETVAAHVDLASAYVEQGMLVRSELLRAEVERSRIEDLLAEAAGQARVAEASLSLRLASDGATSWQIESLPEPEPLAEGLADWLAGTSARRDLAAARQMLAAGELEVGIRRAGRKPRLALVARQDYNDDSLFGTGGASTAVMAVAGVDLFSGGRHRAAAAAAAAEVEAARREIELFEEGIQLEVRHGWERASTARERHATAVAARGAAAEMERITRARFAKGVAKTLDLVDAVTARREAETRELMARAEAHLATFRLAVAGGRSPESVLPTNSLGMAESAAEGAVDGGVEGEGR
jgi:outer membrane protein TolC